MAFMDGVERIYYPIEITSSNNQIRFREDGTETTITLDTGIYWTHDDLFLANRTTHSTYPSIYREILSKIEADGAVSNEYRVFDDRDASGLKSARLRLNRRKGTNSYALLFGHSDFTLDPRVLSFPESKSTTVTNSSNDIEGEISFLGKWQSPSSAVRQDVRRNDISNVKNSDASNQKLNRNATSSRSVRTFSYLNVPAAYVFEDRALLSEKASEANLNQNDTANALESLFRAAGLGRFITIFEQGDYTPNTGDANLKPVQAAADPDVANTGAELEKMQYQTEIHEVNNPRVRLSDIVEYQSQYDGEYYDVSWDWRVFDEPYLKKRAIRAKYDQ